MRSQLPVEEWFIFRQDAVLSYLGEVLREVRWKASEDPLIERLGLNGRWTLVRVLDSGREGPRPSSPCVCGCRNYFPRCKRRGRPSVRCAFRFEMDRGRPGMGHEYVLESAGTATGALFWRMDAWDRRASLPSVEDLNPEDLLTAIREIVVAEVMGA